MSTQKRIPKLIDNRRDTMAEVLKSIAPDYDTLAIATGYWNLEGMQQILENLDGYKKIRLLIGREPMLPRHKLDLPEPDYPDVDFFHDLEALTPLPDLKTAIIKIKQLILDGRLEVHVYRKAFLHAKCYIFGSYETATAVGVVGSSNFTLAGLTKNAELNATESDHRIVTFKPLNEEQEVGHLYWFDQFWNDSEVWNGKFTELLEYSPVGDQLFSPYETYIKTLHELYAEELEETELDARHSGAYELFDFQKKNAQRLLSILNKHGVAMLSDSVGLGKTITAIEVIRMYADSPEGRRRVAVVCPKSLKEQWDKELERAELSNIRSIVLQNPQSIEKERDIDQIASVSLFVIDESHNLRKTAGTRYKMMTDWIRNNNKAHVLLLTATPINNELGDLTSQLLLGTRGDPDGITATRVNRKTGQSDQVNFAKAIEDLQKKIKRQLAAGDRIDPTEIKAVMSPILRSVVVRRTRQGIEKEYGSLIINGEPKRFPECIPDNHPYQFDLDLTEKILKGPRSSIDLAKIYSLDPAEIAELCTDLKHPLDQLDRVGRLHSPQDLVAESPIFFIFQLILMLGFVPYRWRMYQTQYYGKSAEELAALKLTGDDNRALQQQRGIYGILRTVFLKRIESSVEAFQVSLGRYGDRLKEFEDELNQYSRISLSQDQAKIDRALAEEDGAILDGDLDAEGEVESQFELVDEHRYNLPALLKDIEREREVIEVLRSHMKHLAANDAKLASFVELLHQLKASGDPASNKVLVFSYYADTVEYLKRHLPELAVDIITTENTGFVTRQNRNDAETLAGRFAPRSKGHQFKPGETELSYLISTDVLSEGQNLQDSGTIINYDLHWNPVRMIQRNGRISRLGTEFDTVHIYNMKPEIKLESYLKLVKRLEQKIEIISFTIGSDQSVMGEAINAIDFIDNLNEIYTNPDQAQRIAAMQEAEKAGDFLLAEDDFVDDLKAFNRSTEFSDAYKAQVYGIARGKWALMPQAQVPHLGERPEVMMLSRLKANEVELTPQFVRISSVGDGISAVPTSTALEYLRTNADENTRVTDKISIDKRRIVQIATDPSVYVESHQSEPASGQKLEVLRLLVELTYSAETIEALQDAYDTTNRLYQNEIGLLVRKIMKAKRENKPYVDPYLNQLLALAESVRQTKVVPLSPNDANPALYYVRANG